MVKPEMDGLIRDEPNDVYHANEAVSHSKLKKFIQRPLLYDGLYVTKNLIKPAATKSMKGGSLFHTLLLEPDKFFTDYMILPDKYDSGGGVMKPWNGNANVCKAHIAEAEAAGKNIVTRAEYMDAKFKALMVRDHPVIGKLLAGGEPELTWRISEGRPFPMQARTDYFNFTMTQEQAGVINEFTAKLMVIDKPAVAGEPYVMDYKTTMCLDDWFRENYGSTVLKYGYHTQQEFYRSIVNDVLHRAGHPLVRFFFFMVQETSEPYDCMLGWIDRDTADLAGYQNSYNLRALAKAYKIGKWIGYRDQGVMLIGIPEHIRSRIQEETLEKHHENPEWLVGGES